MKIEGTVVYQHIEGGFWGIIGDDGRKYRPVEGLPPFAQVEGCRVEADVEAVEGVSFAMWGRNVRVNEINRR